MPSLRVKLSLAASVLLALPACTTVKSASETNPLPVQMAKQFTFERTEPLKVNYLLHLPQAYSEASNQRWPLILFLHGSGERGNDVWKVAVHGPPKIVTNGADFPFILVSPQCPAHQQWSRDVLMGLLEDIIARWAVDTNRIYLTGLSMGGYGTWELGLSHPEKFAAIAPICGGGEMISLLLSSLEKPAALKSLGIWAFHGGKDPVVPLAESERMVDAVRKVGVRDVKFTIYPEAGHDSWTETYKNQELYDWFLKHSRDGHFNNQ